MNKIYEQAKDLHVVATCVYGSGENTNAYMDAECTKQFTSSELKEVFIKGALIKFKNNDVICKATSFENGVIYFYTSGGVESLTSVADEVEA